MVARVTTRINTTSIDAAIDAAINLPDVIAEAGDKAKTVIENPLLNRLRQPPPPAKKPIQWTSERQRKFVMAKLRRENNLPYKRTERFVRGWYVRSRQVRQAYLLVVGNDAPVTQYIVGTLSQRSRNEAIRPMQQFHANTGWPVAVDVINPEIERFTTEFNKFLTERFDERLATSRTRRSITTYGK